MKSLLLFVLLAFTAGCTEASPREAALRIGFASGGLCSATAVAEDVILTAAHCFEGHDRLTSINGQPAYALKRVDDGKDHVLVRVSKHFKRWARIGSNPAVGEHVIMYGNALGLNFAFREAYVSLVEVDQILYAGGITGPGDSGSGLFANDGRVVGVVTGVKSQVIKGNYIFFLMWTMPLSFTQAQLAEMV